MNWTPEELKFIENNSVLLESGNTAKIYNAAHKELNTFALRLSAARITISTLYLLGEKFYFRVSNYLPGVTGSRRTNVCDFSLISYDQMVLAIFEVDYHRLRGQVYDVLIRDYGLSSSMAYSISESMEKITSYVF